MPVKPSEMRDGRQYKLTLEVEAFNRTSMGCRVRSVGGNLAIDKYLYLSDMDETGYQIVGPTPGLEEPAEPNILLVRRETGAAGRQVLVQKIAGRLWKPEGWNSRSWDALLDLFPPDKWFYRPITGWRELTR